MNISGDENRELWHTTVLKWRQKSVLNNVSDEKGYLLVASEGVL